MQPYRLGVIFKMDICSRLLSRRRRGADDPSPFIISSYLQLYLGFFIAKDKNAFALASQEHPFRKVAQIIPYVAKVRRVAKIRKWWLLRIASG